MVNIETKGGLGGKLTNLQSDQYIQRIFSTIKIFNSQSELVYETDGIIDTGATITILPGKVLKELGSIQTEPQTMWGVINKEECKFTVDLGKVQIKLVDLDNNESKLLLIIAGFPRKDKIPVLIGMKDILSKYDYSFISKENLFIIQM